MKISILCDLKELGGAAVACNRISDALEPDLNEVWTISCDSKQNRAQFQETLFLGKKYQLFNSFLKGILPHRVLENNRIREWKRQLALLLQTRRPDLINCHNLHSASLPIGIISTALHHAPVVWTLHDCWSFLGTYYPSHSPDPSPQTLAAMDNFWTSEKRRQTRTRFSAVTPSAWMRDQASASQWKDILVETIHNPIPDSFFEYRDRKGCKSALGLDTDKPIVLCVAGNLEEERKGGPILKEVLDAKLQTEVQFLLIGSGCFDSYDDSKVKNLGFVSDELTLQIAYHASDLLLHPAPIDNLPNTVAESMSCGTPVLAFDTGGLPEMAIPGKSGWLVNDIDAAAMISELSSVLVSKDFENLRESTKEHARLHFDSRTVADQYKKHFESVITAQN